MSKINIPQIGRFATPSKQLGFSLIAGLIAVLISLPLILLVNMSFMSNRQFLQDPLSFPETILTENYVIAWNSGLSQYMLNSAIVTFIGLFILITICSLAAYALVEFDIPAANAILLFLIAGFMVPPPVLLVPVYTIVDVLGFMSTYQGLIIVYVAFAISFSIFFLRQYFLTIPEAYAEAARIDGYSELQIFLRVYLPISLPAITTVAVFQYIQFWNEFLYAFVIMVNQGMRTTPAGLAAFKGEFLTNYTVMGAGVIIAILPAIAIFMLLRNYFIRGFSMGNL